MRHLFLIPAVLVAVLGCDKGAQGAHAAVDPMPTAVSCTDASQLKQRALEDRRLRNELKGDRAKIIVGSRAKFLASLAIVAELECRVDAAATDSVLARAFDAARVAETTSGEYEAAIKWMEADLVAADAIALLISRLPAQSTR
jgi:hypothetical protein